MGRRLLPGLLAAWLAIGASDNDIFGSELLEQDEAENRRHLSSSVEDLGGLLCREQRLLAGLAAFHAEASAGASGGQGEAAGRLLRALDSLARHRWAAREG
jgi:hypothetical protein